MKLPCMVSSHQRHADPKINYALLYKKRHFAAYQTNSIQTSSNIMHITISIMFKSFKKFQINIELETSSLRLKIYQVLAAVQTDDG